METPTVRFRYSSVYDRRFKETAEQQGCDMEKYPSRDDIQTLVEAVGPVWRKHETSVLTEMADIVNLTWDADTITCYVVGRCIPFSDPLTIGYLHHEETSQFIDTLTHELIHQLFIQGISGNGNWKEQPVWQYFWETYKDEPRKTKIHIPVYAIHEHLYRELFTVERMERDIAKMKKVSQDHYQAWQIVQDEGYEQILERFREKIER